jgi:hypothetical protein
MRSFDQQIRFDPAAKGWPVPTQKRIELSNFHRGVPCKTLTRLHAEKGKPDRSLRERCELSAKKRVL